MGIEQDIKTIITLLESIAGKKAAAQIETAFSGAGIPAATTDFATIKSTIPSLSKDQINQWSVMCIEKAVSDKQKGAIAKIFKTALGGQ